MRKYQVLAVLAAGLAATLVPSTAPNATVPAKHNLIIKNAIPAAVPAPAPDGIAAPVAKASAAGQQAEAAKPAAPPPVATASAPATPAPAAPPATPAAAVQSAPAAAAEPAAAAAPVQPEPPKPVPPSLIARVNLTTQTMQIVVHGKSLHSWKISSGRDGYLTPVGNFKPDWMSKMWYSKQYDNAPMPHAVFFKGGAAIHATNSIGSLGQPASHGCVRLAPANAETFYKLVTRHGLTMTRVVVSGKPPIREERIARRDMRVEPTRVRTAYNAAIPITSASYAPRAMIFPGDGYARSAPSRMMPANTKPYWLQ